MLVFKETWWILRVFSPSINQRGYRKGDSFLFFSTPDCAFKSLLEYLFKSVDCLPVQVFRGQEYIILVGVIIWLQIQHAVWLLV